MPRCDGCGGIWVGTILLNVTIRPVWSLVDDRTDDIAVYLCRECLDKLAAGRDVIANKLVEYAP